MHFPIRCAAPDTCEARGAVAPESARAALASIRASGIQPQAFDAGMSINDLDRGIFKPT
jgi:hypothetical protein